MINIIEKFLNQKCARQQPVLLALSGGPDSLVLLHLFLEYQKKNMFQFSVAHVDHGWRPESVEEARALLNYCQDLSIPFYLKTLDPKTLKGNLEAACREERLSFFAQLCSEKKFQAVILGHHADDHSETVFKRLLEGTTLSHLRGLSEETLVNGVKLWRPLLQVTKKEIEEYVVHHGLNPFYDSTNLDPKYLRTRLRMLMPELSQRFGKNVRDTLHRLSKESVELHDYLSHKLSDHPIHSGPLGSYIKFSHTLHPFEIRFLLRKLCERENVFFSHPLIDQACQHILDKQTNCQVLMGEKTMYIDRGYVFVLRQVDIPERQLLSDQFGPWQIKWENGSCDWESIWSGTIPINLPSGDYEIGLADRSLNKKWSNAKIPAFLKSFIPVIWKDNTIVWWPNSKSAQSKPQR